MHLEGTARLRRLKTSSLDPGACLFHDDGFLSLGSSNFRPNDKKQREYVNGDQWKTQSQSATTSVWESVC